MAIIKPSYDINRKDLRKILPLSGPYTIFIEPTRTCNLKCFFCIHATRGIQGGVLERTGVPLSHIDMGMYEKITHDVMEFPESPKRIVFSGLGEPLMNPRLGDMARMLREAGYKGRNDIITNAVLLTPERSAELLDAGITQFFISVQGMTSERYKEICGVAVDMDEYVDNIRWLFEHRKNTKIYIKIIDANLQHEQEKEQFYKMFGDICDTIYIEHLIVMQRQNAEYYIGAVDNSINLNSEVIVKHRKVCSVMFYLYQVTIEGNVYPCTIPGIPQSLSMGNVKDSSLLEIWNGVKRSDMCRTNLKEGYRAIPGCVPNQSTSCVCADGILDPNEYLDDCAGEILERLTNRV